MPNAQALHEIIAAWALFVGAFQLVLRWMWASNFRRVDAIAMRLWAISTMTTATVIAATMYYFRHTPTDRWFLLVIAVVAAKTIAAVWAVVALRSWWRRAAIHGTAHDGPF